MNLLFWRRKEVIPEKLWALRNKLPSALDVELTSSKDGGFVARVTNLPGCFTEGETFQEVYEMVNEAVYDYFDVPSEYVPHVRSYSPPKEVIDEMAVLVHEDARRAANGGEAMRSGKRMVFQAV